MKPPKLLRHALLTSAACAALCIFAPAVAADQEPAKDMLLQADIANYDSKAKIVTEIDNFFMLILPP